jgi:hypothetical protein
MTTTAQLFTGFEAGNTDAMDLLSDHGYDTGNADIEFDLDSTGGNQPQEDDVLSLQDAITDGGANLHHAGDVDDFMIDKDDLIEVDEINYDDLELDDAQPPADSPNHAHGGVEQSNSSNTVLGVEKISDSKPEYDEDLIDYSDEEEDQDEGKNLHTGSQGLVVPPNEYAEDVVGEAEGAAEVQDDLGDNNESSGDYDQGGEQQVSDDVEQPQEETVTTDGLQVRGPDSPATNHAESESYDGVPDQEHVEINLVPEDAQHVDLSKTVENTERNSQHEQVGQIQSKSESQDDTTNQQPPLHPVLINYDGEESWLFKPHDHEDSSWLLDDESAALQQFPYLFHACRAQLGEDVDSDTEIGFRFDHLHALELFEDCTACAYTTLKELLDIYLSLHAQDGNIHPEPFYISLQFRPRALTLVNELKKAVQDQIGFTGINSAIASGQSRFNNGFTNDFDEKSDEQWDAEEHEQSKEQEVSIQGAAQATEHTAKTEHKRLQPDHKEDPLIAAPENAEAETGVVEHHSSADSSSEDAADPEPNDEEEDDSEDLIDYDDDDDDGEVEGDMNKTEVGQNTTKELSSASSTVQGDETSAKDDAEDLTNNDDLFDDDRQSLDGEDEIPVDNLDEPSTTDFGVHETYAQYDEEDGTTAGLHEDLALDQFYDPTYEQHGDTQYGEQAELSTHEDDGGYYYGDDENANFDQDELALTVAGGDLDNLISYGEDGQSTAGDDFTGVGDFLDLDAGAGPTVDGAADAGIDNGTELEDYHYDQEGVTEQASVAASSAASPVAASTVGLGDLDSPQGQKRSIDEVDVGLDGAGDTTGTFEEFFSIATGADPYLIDAKRTKL